MRWKPGGQQHSTRHLPVSARAQPLSSTRVPFPPPTERCVRSRASVLAPSAPSPPDAHALPSENAPRPPAWRDARQRAQRAAQRRSAHQQTQHFLVASRGHRCACEPAPTPPRGARAPCCPAQSHSPSALPPGPLACAAHRDLPLLRRLWGRRRQTRGARERWQWPRLEFYGRSPAVRRMRPVKDWSDGRGLAQREPSRENLRGKLTPSAWLARPPPPLPPASAARCLAWRSAPVWQPGAQ
mmetsp:Transcript_44304/g.109687  ORF Transcript_44304/g.109687 Transcript_44304/m.109687 type:complete len:241 (-) Transcript_44304:1820-2542(-)